MCRLVCQHFALQRGSRAKRQQPLASVYVSPDLPTDLAVILAAAEPQYNNQFLQILRAVPPRNRVLMA